MILDSQQFVTTIESHQSLAKTDSMKSFFVIIHIFIIVFAQIPSFCTKMSFTFQARSFPTGCC